MKCILKVSESGVVRSACEATTHLGAGKGASPGQSSAIARPLFPHARILEGCAKNAAFCCQVIEDVNAKKSAEDAEHTFQPTINKRSQAIFRRRLLHMSPSTNAFEAHADAVRCGLMNKAQLLLTLDACAV